MKNDNFSTFSPPVTKTAFSQTDVHKESLAGRVLMDELYKNNQKILCSDHVRSQKRELVSLMSANNLHTFSAWSWFCSVNVTADGTGLVLSLQVDTASTSLRPARTSAAEFPLWPKRSWSTAWRPSVPRWSRLLRLFTTRFHQHFSFMMSSFVDRTIDLFQKASLVCFVELSCIIFILCVSGSASGQSSQWRISWSWSSW